MTRKSNKRVKKRQKGKVGVGKKKWEIGGK